MKGECLPLTPPSTWSYILNPAFITCSLFNKRALGHCMGVGGPDLPLTPLSPLPPTLGPDTALRMDAAPHVCALSLPSPSSSSHGPREPPGKEPILIGVSPSVFLGLCADANSTPR